VLDHHKTAEAQLKEFIPASWDYDGLEEMGEGIFAQFDMKRSGAAMTWDFCFPGKELPWLIKYVQDRDLWTKKYPQTSAVHLLLESYGYDYEQWDELLINFDSGHGMDLYIREAEAIERYYNRQIEEMARLAELGWVAGHKVPVAYVPYVFVSDVCAKLLEMYPEVPFACAIVKSYGETTYSLRSTDSRTDVSEIAKKYGGGGHRNAAGFRMP
jgi:uncharacterized protein